MYMHTNLEANANKMVVQSDINLTDNALWPMLKPSRFSQRLHNNVRAALALLKSTPPNKNYSLIRMDIGDPTVGVILQPDEAVMNAVHNAVDNGSFNGYTILTQGIEVARQAIVRHFSTSEAPFTADDVIISSGATHAIYMAIEAIADPGDNILVPTPTFPTYGNLADGCGVETREYRLMIENDCQVDLHHLESLIDNRTKAIIVNNPSNPTGTVFTAETLQGIVNIAYRHKVIIMSDEIYSDIVYNGAKFHPIAEINPKVPVIVFDSVSKRYLVPGWRLGWMILHNRYNALDKVRQGIIRITLQILGQSVLLQGALPEILDNTPKSAIEKIKTVAERNTNALYDCLKKIPGLRPMRAFGGIFMVVRVDPKLYGDTEHFIIGLIEKKSVFVMPGRIFNLPEWFRITLTFPNDAVQDVCRRIADYCNDLLMNKNI